MADMVLAHTHSAVMRQRRQLTFLWLIQPPKQLLPKQLYNMSAQQQPLPKGPVAANIQARPAPLSIQQRDAPWVLCLTCPTLWALSSA